MRKLSTTVITLLLTVLYSLAQDNEAIVKSLFSETPAAASEKVSAYAPVSSAETIAKKLAAKTVLVTKDNITTTLTEAKQYKYGILIVGNHTIVKITDFGKCNTSGSWGACMPYGKGYVKKGTLQEQNDYINNIIGRPDDQVRTLYLFN